MHLETSQVKRDEFCGIRLLNNNSKLQGNSRVQRLYTVIRTHSLATVINQRDPRIGMVFDSAEGV